MTVPALPAAAPTPDNSWKPYPAYKDSGAEWLGCIPAHWSVQRLKFGARFMYGDALASDTREDGDVPVFGSNGPVGCHVRANTVAPVLVIGRKGSFGKVNYTRGTGAAAPLPRRVCATSEIRHTARVAPRARPPARRIGHYSQARLDCVEQ